MSVFLQIMQEDQRFLILKALIDLGYDANVDMLITSLDAYGHRLSHTAMQAHIDWLATAQLVSVFTLGSILKVELTRKGQDVAEGRESFSGVRRPKAGE